MRRLFAILGLSILLSASPDVLAADRDPTPEERYELGMKYMRRGYYTKALEAFNRVRNYHRDDPASVKAELAIADVYFKKAEYEQARLQYEDFARLHPRHADMDYVVWRIGECLFKRAPGFAGRDQTPTRRAVDTWSGFQARFPNSEHTAEVSELLQKGRDRLARKELFIAKFYEKRDAWGAVRRRAEGLIRRYPESTLVPEAFALAGEAAHRWGAGDDARLARDRLAALAPDSPWLKRLDGVLATPLGVPPEERTFLRPYRLSTGSGGGGAAGGGMGGGMPTQ